MLNFKKFPVLKEKAPKLVNFSILLALVIVLMLVILPLMKSFEENFVIFNINFYTVLEFLTPIAALYMIFKIARLMFPLADEIANQFVKTIPGLKSSNKASLKRILNNFAYIIIIILVIGTFTPLISRSSDFVGSVFNAFGILIIIILFYDSGRTFYLIAEGKVENVKNKAKNSSKRKK